MSPADRLCLALDVDDLQTAADWVTRTRGAIGTYKIGLQLFCAEGPAVVAAVRRAGARQVFLDLKLHDIPNTVAKAVTRLGGLGVDLLTVHGAGGGAMLSAAAEAARPAGIKLLAVTVLTSLDEAQLAAVGCSGALTDVVAARARLAARQGLGGLVCSPHEAASLRPVVGPEVTLVTPGIRLSGGATHDQTRVSDPATAVRLGADLLVVGRAITAASDPDQAVAAFHEALT